MRLQPFVVAFSLLWLTIAGSFTVYLLAVQRFTESVVVPMGMFIFGFFLVNGAFWHEAINSRKFLIEILDARMEREGERKGSRR